MSEPLPPHSDGDRLPRDPAEALRQTGIRAWFETDHGSGQWTVAYNNPSLAGGGIALFAFLAPPGYRALGLTDTNWEMDGTDGTPGMSQWHDGDGVHITYHRYGNDQQFEPLIVLRSFPNYRPDYPEVIEELRHAFNLWENFDTRTLFEIDDAGNEIESVRVTEHRVEIRTSLLRRFQALKQMDVVFLMISDVWLDESPEASAAVPDCDEWNSADSRAQLHAGAIDGRVYSRLRAKKILKPPSREYCGLWFFEPDDEYISFQIGEDDVGRAVEFTCDPDVLGNRFGANPASPQYLTPIYFDAAVLQKYYEDHQRYQVKEGYLSAHGSWGMQIDNDNGNGVVSAWLGDLGRDLPLAEQRHWRSFNILAPMGGVGETAFRRQILGQWVGSQSPDHRFKALYADVSGAWEQRHGWPLFLPLRPGDEHVLSSLRLPLGQTDREFDTQLINLAKLLVDSLNEAEFTKAVGSGPSKEMGIAKFERYLASLGVSEAPEIADVLRDVQGLRSRGAAHRKGHDFDLAKAGLDPSDLRSSFGSLLERCVQVLTILHGLATRT